MWNRVWDIQLTALQCTFQNYAKNIWGTTAGGRCNFFSRVVWGDLHILFLDFCDCSAYATVARGLLTSSIFSWKQKDVMCYQKHFITDILMLSLVNCTRIKSYRGNNMVLWFYIQQHYNNPSVFVICLSGVTGATIYPIYLESTWSFLLTFEEGESYSRIYVYMFLFPQKEIKFNFNLWRLCLVSFVGLI